MPWSLGGTLSLHRPSERGDSIGATGDILLRGCCNNTATGHQINILRPQRRDQSIAARKPARGCYK